MNQLLSLVKDKRVLFITVKNLDYIRITQELNILKESTNQLDVIGSYSTNYVRRILHTLFNIFLCKAKNYDVVFVSFLPQLILPIFSRKFRHNTIISDFFVSMYDTLCLDRRIIKTQGLLGRLTHKLDSIALNKSNLVISDTNTDGDYFAKEFNVSRERIATLYLEPDTSIYYPMDIERSDYLQGKYVVLYFGSILPLQGIDIIIDAYKKIALIDEIHLFLIGPCNNTDLNALSSYNNVTTISWLTQRELARYIAIADLCLAGHFRADIDKARRTIPGKAYIYEAMGKKMILGDSPANHELFTADTNHIFVPMGDSNELVSAILKASNEP